MIHNLYSRTLSLSLLLSSFSKDLWRTFTTQKSKWKLLLKIGRSYPGPYSIRCNCRYRSVHRPDVKSTTVHRGKSTSTRSLDKEVVRVLSDNESLLRKHTCQIPSCPSPSRSVSESYKQVSYGNRDTTFGVKRETSIGLLESVESLVSMAAMGSPQEVLLSL